MRLFSNCLFAAVLLSGSLTAQTSNNPFTRVSADAYRSLGRLEMPSEMETFEADFHTLDQLLRQAPKEQEAQRFSVVLPVAGQNDLAFAIWQVDIMHPDLGARYPEIQTYAGEALDGSGRLLRITTSPAGFRAMYLLPDGRREYLEPWNAETPHAYVLYDGRSVPLPEGVSNACGVSDHSAVLENAAWAANPSAGLRGSFAPVPLRIYRFACATTGGYAQDNGGTVSSALASVVDKVNQINAPIERDVALRLQLIPQNDQLIFLDNSTDPYTGTNLANWIDENNIYLNSTIGVGAYDLGHVIGRGTGSGVIGLASLSSACTVIKGSGASSGLPPYGLFFIGTFAHEVGHQLSATHTYSYCPPNDVTAGTAFEPASGSTIMSYGGVCGQQNVVNLTDLYYHNVSVQQMRNFTTNGNGSLCGTLENTTNNSPEVASVTPDSLYLPISTPFELKSAGSDPDGDQLTYCWEEFDLGESVALGDEGMGSPLFRSFPPASSPNRTFPRLSTIVANGTDPAEILPTMTRQLNFRVTVRDNNPQSGGVAWDNLRLFVTDQAGPFLVQNPNAANVTWEQGAYVLVEWDVAGTDQAPVNCRVVNIRLSTDGGFTYPIELAAGVANSGSAYVQVPANATTNSARVRVEAADNAFFDISNANFRITPPQTAGFSMGLSQAEALLCIPTTYSIGINTSSLLGFNEPLKLELPSGLPVAGALVAFDPPVINPGQSAVLTLDLSGATANGDFPLTIRASGTTDTVTLPFDLTLVYNDFSLLTTALPANGANGVGQTPVLRWSTVPGIANYEVQLAGSPSFDAGSLLASQSNIASDSFQIPVILTKGAVYYWRVRALNPPCNSDWTAPSAFVVGIDQCVSFEATDLPQNIPTSVATIESKISLPAGAIISDVNVKKIQGFHENFQHLDMRLRGPGGAPEATLINASCGTNGSFNFGFDDASLSNFACPPSNSGAVYKPKTPLSVFNGIDGGGEWTLRVRDVLAGSGGQIQAFEFEVCSSVALNGPFIVNNKPLVLPGGNNAGIGADLLKTEDNNNGPDQLVYTIMTLPQYGRLEWFNVPVVPGDQFTQVDIDNGALRFFDYGNNPTGTDAFLFSVTDNEGGLAAGVFVIQPSVSTGGPAKTSLSFALAPNPGAGRVQVIFPEALTSEAWLRVFSADGKLLFEQTAPQGAVNHRLPLSSAPDGLYFVHLQNRTGYGVQRLLIRR